MKILLVHNYLRPPSGENTVFEQERDLLRSKGNTVITYTRHNHEIYAMQSAMKAMVPIRAIWSSKAHRDFMSIIEKEKPDIAHFHNVFPLITPSVYRACHNSNTPVVQTLHNYRIVCPGALLFRNDELCTACSGMHFFPGIKYGCYRNSRIFTAGMAGVVLFHKVIGTWKDSVDLYIALSEFARKKFVDLGFPSNSFFVKPNFLHYPIDPNYDDKGYGIFIGRIGAEKGIKYLMSALRNCPNLKFKIVGDGPLVYYVKKKINDFNLRLVDYLGIQDHKQCMRLLSDSRFHVLPSQFYEGIPMALLEAMSAGKPSIVSDVGVLPTMVIDGVDGFVFKHVSVESLAKKLRWMAEHPKESCEMGKKARQSFEQNFMREKNYKLLIRAYKKATEIHYERPT